jgi:hypothetical protein
MEESVAKNPEQVLLNFWPLSVEASGTVALIVGCAVAVLILAFAWRLVR